MSELRIVLIIYIHAPVDQVWDALTNPEITVRYWGDTRIESDWRVGSPIIYRRLGEITDEHTVLEYDKLKRLRHTFHPVFEEFKDEAPSEVTMQLEALGPVTRLEILHDHFPPGSKVHAACSEGWPMIISSLKTLLETGDPLPEFPVE